MELATTSFQSTNEKDTVIENPNNNEIENPDNSEIEMKKATLISEIVIFTQASSVRQDVTNKQDEEVANKHNDEEASKQNGGEEAYKYTNVVAAPQKVSVPYKQDEVNSVANIAILGNGNYGRALSSQFQQAGLQYCIGSRSVENIENDQLVLSYEDAIGKSDILFLCVPPYSYDTSIAPLSNILRDKIIVDVSNLENESDDSNALKLQQMLPSSYVIKGLNTVSAYSLENEAYGASRDTFVCGDNEEKKKKVMDVLREIGLNPLDKGRLQSAIMIEKLPHRFFPNWGRAIAITVALLIPIWFYMYLKFFWFEDEHVEKEKNDLGLYVANRVIAWTMFWLLALTYFPGVIAGFIQIVRRTKHSKFPAWLDKWMKCRKQLGLISLLLACIHGCMSCLLLGAGELKHMLTKTPILGVNSKVVQLYQLLKWSDQLSLLFAVLALALMGILGITSLPSVNARMSWKEWNFVQSGLGFTSLLFGFTHVMIYVYTTWYPENWSSYYKPSKGIFPPGAFVMPMFPLIVIILKLVLMLPGVSCHLDRIRNGKIGYKNSKAKV